MTLIVVVARGARSLLNNYIWLHRLFSVVSNTGKSRTPLVASVQVTCQSIADTPTNAGMAPNLASAARTTCPSKPIGSLRANGLPQADSWGWVSSLLAAGHLPVGCQRRAGLFFVCSQQCIADGVNINKWDRPSQKYKCGRTLSFDFCLFYLRFWFSSIEHKILPTYTRCSL